MKLASNSLVLDILSFWLGSTVSDPFSFNDTLRCDAKIDYVVFQTLSHVERVSSAVRMSNAWITVHAVMLEKIMLYFRL